MIRRKHSKKQRRWRNQPRNSAVPYLRARIPTLLATSCVAVKLLSASDVHGVLSRDYRTLPRRIRAAEAWRECQHSAHHKQRKQCTHAKRWGRPRSVGARMIPWKKIWGTHWKATRIRRRSILRNACIGISRLIPAPRRKQARARHCLSQMQIPSSKAPQPTRSEQQI
jgi:hypothetical protein